MPPMKTDFLAGLLGSPARARLLRIFLYDPEHEFQIKELAKRAAISPAATSREVKLLEKIGVVKKGKHVSITLNNGTKRKVTAKKRIETWSIEPSFPHLATLTRFVHEVSPMRYEAVLEAVKKCGRVSVVVLSGTFMGDPSRPADMIVAGDDVKVPRLEAATKRLESTLGREIRYACFPTAELRYRMTVQDRLIRDTLDYPHLVLLDRAQIF